MERMWALDGLRGLAAISVVVYHGLYWHGGLLYSSAGRFAVYLFFILSAMTMTKVYKGRFSETVDVHAVGTFYRNRVARILPLLALVATLNLAFGLSRGGGLDYRGCESDPYGNWCIWLRRGWRIVEFGWCLVYRDRDRILCCVPDSGVINL